jgi:hypothetical protein
VTDTPPLPRRFHLQCGNARPADGVLWADGTATTRWLDDDPATTAWPTADAVAAAAARIGAVIVWDDPANDDQ